MKRLFVLISALSIICITTNVSHSDDEWAKTYGGGGLYSIQQTTDGGYIVAGDSYGDLLVRKLESNGAISWQKTYGGSSKDHADSIQQTTDGGYIVAGNTLSFGAGGSDMWILKLDQDGAVTWQKTYGGSSFDNASSIHQTTDGGYIVAGYTKTFGVVNEEMWILKLDQDGAVTWQKTFAGGDWSDYAHSIQQTTDGGYIVAGYTVSYTIGTLTDMWILKLDPNGTISWQKTYGGGSSDYAYSIQQTTDGGYIVAGNTPSFGAGSDDMWILKLDPNGTVSWQKTYGGSSNDLAYSIQQTPDGGYIVGGSTWSFGAGSSDMWILKLDPNGTISWQKTYGGDGWDSWDSARCIQQTTDGGYIVAGTFDSPGEVILKLDSNGNIPYCNIINTSNASVTNTSISGQDTSSNVETISVTITDTNMIPQDTSAEVSDICCYQSGDHDCDGIPNAEDNCPEMANGPNLGSCISPWSGIVPCTTDDDCSAGGECCTNQEDTNGDGIGDVCDCMIYWKSTGSCSQYRSPAPTLERSRTQQAAEELYFIQDAGVAECRYSGSWSGDCFTGVTYAWDYLGEYCAYGPYLAQVCLDGSYISCHESEVGTWDVICVSDFDGDGVLNDEDNCPVIPNPSQEDTYPPQGNGIGDACECEADFDCDGDVDGTDATTFKLYFGRNLLFYPCDEINPCRGDFDCDVDVDGTDAALFKTDFGRSGFSNPCPACIVGAWCTYP